MGTADEIWKEVLKDTGGLVLGFARTFIENVQTLAEDPMIQQLAEGSGIPAEKIAARIAYAAVGMTAPTSPVGVLDAAISFQLGFHATTGGKNA